MHSTKFFNVFLYYLAHNIIKTIFLLSNQNSKLYSRTFNIFNEFKIILTTLKDTKSYFHLSIITNIINRQIFT